MTSAKFMSMVAVLVVAFTARYALAVPPACYTPCIGMTTAKCYNCCIQGCPSGAQVHCQDCCDCSTCSAC